MTWDIITRYIAIYHAISHRITTKLQANEPATSLQSTVYFGALSLSSSLLVFLPSHLFLSSFCRPSGTHHRTDSPTSKTKQHPRPLWAWPTSWAHVCVCFIWSFFPPLILSFSAFVVPIQASYLRGTSYFALNWSRRVGWFLVENNFVVRKWM